MKVPLATSAKEMGREMFTMLSAELRQKLRERMAHVLLLGFAVGAMEDLRVLPILLETAPAGKILSSALLIFLNSLTTSFLVITMITAVEQTRLVRNHRVLVLMTTVIVVSVISALFSIVATVYHDGWVGNSLSDEGADLRGLYFHLLWISLSVGLLAAAYFTVWERGQQSATRLRAAELERQGIERQVVESRLNVMKARVEPEFLFLSIGEIQRLYRTDAPAAERHLEDLIAYLRAALPQLRGTASTLGDELHLVSTYLRLHEDAYAGRLDWSFEVDDDLQALHFPPMALLPLVDDALRRAATLSEPVLTLQLRAARSANAPERIAMEVLDDCAVSRVQANGELALVTQERAFADFFGGDAIVRRSPGTNGGTRVILEANFGDGTRSHR
ncbi:MAG: histidine kinase [Betaproteobacteria bacterium]